MVTSSPTSYALPGRSGVLGGSQSRKKSAPAPVATAPCDESGSTAVSLLIAAVFDHAACMLYVDMPYLLTQFAWLKRSANGTIVIADTRRSNERAAGVRKGGRKGGEREGRGSASERLASYDKPPPPSAPQATPLSLVFSLSSEGGA